MDSLPCLSLKTPAMSLGSLWTSIDVCHYLQYEPDLSIYAGGRLIDNGKMLLQIMIYNVNY